MNYKIKAIRSVPDRMYAYREGSEQPIGSFKDYHNGTVYTSAKNPKGEIDIVTLKANSNSHFKQLNEFLRLIDNQKTPKGAFKIKFHMSNFTEEGFKEFLNIIFPNVKKVKKEKTRQYYLKNKINKTGMAEVSSVDNCVYVSDMDMPDIDAKTKKWIMELKFTHKYAIQLTIPG